MSRKQINIYFAVLLAVSRAVRLPGGCNRTGQMGHNRPNNSLNCTPLGPITITKHVLS